MTASTQTQSKPTSAKRRTTTTRHPLHMLVPSKDVHEGYVPRVIDGFTDLDLLEYADKSNMNVLLFGPTGPGKTRVVRSYAALGPVINEKTGKRAPKPFVTVACNGGLDVATFWGQYTKTSTGAIKFIESSVLTVIRFGGVLNLDEVNFLHPRISAVLHGLLDDRRSIVVPELGNELIEAHPDLFVVGTYNPDYQGTRPLNEAFKNRFKIKLEFDYDRAIEEQIVPPFDGVDVTPLLDLAQKLRNQAAEGQLTTPVSTNMLQDFVLIGMDTQSLNFAIRNFVNAFHTDERQAVENNFELIRDELETMIETAVQLSEES